MKVAILTIFPNLFSGFLESSLVKKAQDKDLIKVSLINIRNFASAPHFQVDDIPYGGGAGMVMKPEPLLKAIRHARALIPDGKVVLLTPSGDRFTQEQALNLANGDLILVCGRYEGIDQRVIDLEIDLELSIGDYVLMGGEVPAMVVIEAALRLVPGVLGNSESLKTESFHTVSSHTASSHTETSLLLEAPHYTRPPEIEGKAVPDVLLSGDHKRIGKWREEESQKLTELRRPDLIRNCEAPKK